MLKNLALFFSISLFVGNPSLAGGVFSKKAEVKSWITISKPTGTDLELWNWLASAYKIDMTLYVNDIEFALPHGWKSSLSVDEKYYVVKNERGLAIISLFGTKESSSLAVFHQTNIKLLQEASKKP